MATDKLNLPAEFVTELTILLEKYFTTGLDNMTNNDADSLIGEVVPQKCPRCHGPVLHKQRKNGGSYLSCAKRDFNDMTTCQFSVWDSEQIADFLAGKKVIFKKYDAKKKPEAPSKTASAAPNQEVKDIFAVIDQLNELPTAKRTQILTPLGWDGGSYVMWLNASDPDKIAEVVKALNEESLTPN